MLRHLETGPSKPSITKVTEGSEGALINSRECQLKRWTEHSRDQFSWANSKMGLPLVPVSEKKRMSSGRLIFLKGVT